MTGEIILGYFFDNHRKRAGTHVRIFFNVDWEDWITWNTHYDEAGLPEPAASDDGVICDRLKDMGNNLQS